MSSLAPWATTGRAAGADQGAEGVEHRAGAHEVGTEPHRRRGLEPSVAPGALLFLVLPGGVVVASPAVPATARPARADRPGSPVPDRGQREGPCAGQGVQSGHRLGGFDGRRRAATTGRRRRRRSTPAETSRGSGVPRRRPWSGARRCQSVRHLQLGRRPASTSAVSHCPRARSSRPSSRGTSLTRGITLALRRTRSSCSARFCRSFGVWSPRWAKISSRSP